MTYLPLHQVKFGIEVAEAVACGKPVLITNKVNIWREIESDAAGLVDENTIAGTVRNLQHWLELDALRSGFIFGGWRSGWWRLFELICISQIKQKRLR